MKAHAKVPGHPPFNSSVVKAVASLVRPVREEAQPALTGRQCAAGPSSPGGTLSEALPGPVAQAAPAGTGAVCSGTFPQSVLPAREQACLGHTLVDAGAASASLASSWEAGKPQPVPGEEPCQVHGVAPARPAAAAGNREHSECKEGAWTGSKMAFNISEKGGREQPTPAGGSTQHKPAQATGRAGIPFPPEHEASEAQSCWECCLCSSRRLWETAGMLW